MCKNLDQLSNYITTNDSRFTVQEEEEDTGERPRDLDRLVLHCSRGEGYQVEITEGDDYLGIMVWAGKDLNPRIENAHNVGRLDITPKISPPEHILEEINDMISAKGG